MVSDVVFPFFEILVNSIFGSIAMAIMGVALIILLILFICKVSKEFILYWMIFYFIVMGTLYMGIVGMVLAFIVSITYFIIALIRILFRGD